MPLDFTGIFNASGTTPNPTPGVTAQINIVSQPNLNVSPAAYLFEIINFVGFDTPAPALTHDLRYHELDYVWAFGDPGTFTRPERIDTPFKNSNLMYGPLGKHVFGEGTFTVTCTITEPSSGKVAVATITVTVGNQDAAFPGANTIFIDTTNAGTGAPSGALIRTSFNWDDVTGQETTPKRVMFRRGQTHNFPGVSLNPRLKPSIYIVGEPGSGAAPFCNITGETFWEDNLNTQAAQSKDFVIAGFDMATNYDSSDGSNRLGDRLLFAGRQSDSLGYINIHDVDVDGPTTLFQSQDALPNLNYTLSSSRLRDWAWNGHLCTMLNSFSIIGCAGYHRETATNYSETATNTLYGLWRVTANYGLIKQNDGFNRHGWWGSNVNGIHETQPIGRCNPNNLDGAKWDIQQNAFEAGVEVLSFRPTDHNDTNSINVILERNDLVVNCFGSRLLAMTHRGITARNNRCFVPAADNLVFSPNAFFEYQRPDGGENALSADAAASESRFYNNTLINRKTDANYANGTTANASPSTAQNLPVLNLSNVSSPGQIKEANNLRHQPNVSGGVPDAPIDMTPTFDSRMRDYFDHDTDAIAGTGSPLDTRVVGRPEIGSAAIGSAVLTDPEMVAYRDYDGTVRQAPPSRGALEPA